MVTTARRRRTDPVELGEQLELPMCVDGQPTQPARWVASAAGVSEHAVQRAIARGEIAAAFDGAEWNVPLWAIPAFIAQPTVD